MRRERRGDDGFSLPELMITMTIMAVVMLLFTGAIVQVYRTMRTTESLTDAQAQLSVAFQRFDRQLRYATWVNEPGVPNGSKTWYVEFAGLEGDKCRQLRLELEPAGADGAKDRGLLQLVEWAPGSPPTPGARGVTLASNVDITDLAAAPAEVGVGGKAAPFELQKPGEKPYPSASNGSDFSSEYQRLRIHLKTRVAAGTAEIDTTFTAVNTSPNTSTHQCSEGRP